MTWKCQPIPNSPLKPASNWEQFQIHLAALEWSLTDPIIIHSEADIKSMKHWKDRGLTPYEHQVRNLITFCRRLPVTLLVDDVGLGKTISAGMVLSELMVRGRINRALVICPKILCPQWKEELAKKFGIESTIALGYELKEAFRKSVPVVITTYHSARNHLSKIGEGTFEMIILDEAHKVRNLHSNNPPKMAVNIHRVLANRLFKFVLMLTATPIQNGLLDIYSLLDCMTAAKQSKNPLGSKDEFRTTFIQPGTGDRGVRPDRAEELRAILRQYLARTRREDARLPFPEREVCRGSIPPTREENVLKSIVVELFRTRNLNPLQQTSLAVALMSSPQALAAQMEKMASKGSIPRKFADRTRQIADQCAIPAKFHCLLTILNKLRADKPQEWRAVVFTQRRETQLAIGRALERESISYGFIQGSAHTQNKTSIEGFCAKPVPRIHVIVSTDAGAEGINLQDCNVLINMDLPWNPMVLEQRIGRIQRIGQQKENITVYNLVLKGSVEERVVGRLMEKLQTIAHVVGDIEAILESSVWGKDGDDEESFEKKIRQMVLKALVGRDVEKDEILIVQNIDKAQRLLEKNRQVIDATLGPIGDLGTGGPSVPKLTRKPPSIGERDFVLRAVQAEGARIDQVAGEKDTYQVQIPGRLREFITFDETAPQRADQEPIFHGNLPKVYLPGKPPFEKLVQHWVDHYGHLLRDWRSRSDSLAKELGRSWCLTVPNAEFLDAEFMPRQTAFQGEITVKAKAGNSVDSYEKLIEMSSGPPGHATISKDDDSDLLTDENIVPSEKIRSIREDVSTAVESDADIREFCRFYEQRLSEELEKVGIDERKRRKITDDFAPVLFGEIVALEGSVYHVGQLKVKFKLDGDHVYDATLEAIPATGQILNEPRRIPSSQSHRNLPEPCLAVCEISGQMVEKHRLTASEMSGRLALPEHTAVCSSTQQRVLEDELESEAITGQKVIGTLLVPSQISGRKAFRENLVFCEITGAEVLKDEVIRSEVSGRMFRHDEKVASAVSGAVGHRSEFYVCETTKQPIRPSESGKSAYSGKTVRKDLLQPSEKEPHRLGLEEEFVVCEKSGKKLLRDEVGQSAVSGKWGDQTLLRRSGASIFWAFPDELVKCQETGIDLLPNETGRCVVTGKVVDRRLMGTSEVSGKFALKRELCRCAKTKMLVLPSELMECEKTHVKVLPTELAVCAVTGLHVLKDHLWASAKSGALALPEKMIRCAETDILLLPNETDYCALTKNRVDRRLLAECDVSGKLALKRLMAKSDYSGRIGLPECAVDSAVSGKVCLKKEARKCSWLQAAILPNEGQSCVLCGRFVARKYLNQDGELEALRLLLDGRAKAAKDATHLQGLIDWLRGKFKGIRRVQTVVSPSKKTCAVCCEIRSFLGLKVRYMGCLMVRKAGNWVLLGTPLIGRRTKSGWVAEPDQE